LKLQKQLFLLDLDHTLIYGSYAQSETAQFLFQHNEFLSVYERPYSRELVNNCRKLGDIIIYTTSLKKYAHSISQYLNIQPVQILSRKQCPSINNIWRKVVREKWLKAYENITIIDDSPNFWMNADHSKINFIVPSEFRGDKNDNELQKTIKAIFKSKS
jgi:TFIIF-interacting CTD phosphatase-like protein